jgi:hypothetical protein
MDDLHEHFCLECSRPFYLHPSCYRGHKYCSKSCRTEARKRKQRVSRRNYDTSRHALDLSADRQHELRQRRKLKNKTAQKASANAAKITPGQSMVQHKAHVTYQATSPQEGALGIVAARPGGLAVSNEGLDAKMLAGDFAGLAGYACVFEERGGQERAPSAVALQGAAVVPVLCARCGEPGRIFRHPTLARRL